MTTTLTPALEGIEFIEGAPASRTYLHTKRVVDVVLASAAIVGLSPLMLLIALAVLLDGGGPVIFAQERVGSRPRRRRGELVWELGSFRVLKFRTMRADPERADLHAAFVRSFVAGELIPEPGAAAAFKLAGDPRVTHVGRWLRAMSLDELPQLFNVVAGDMSLVGPRPVPHYEVAAYGPQHVRRLAATPGITGLWQVHGRGRVPFEEMVRMDIEYVNRRSLRLDAALLAQTLPSVLSGEGAR